MSEAVMNTGVRFVRSRPHTCDPQTRAGPVDASPFRGEEASELKEELFDLVVLSTGFPGQRMTCGRWRSVWASN